jgi:hypothetical protein
VAVNERHGRGGKRREEEGRGGKRREEENARSRSQSDAVGALVNIPTAFRRQSAVASV